MPSSKRGLGRGLDALIPTELSEAGALAAAGKVAEGERVEQVGIGRIKPNPLQPRQQFDEAELNDLAASIKAHGIVQPLVASRLADGSYELIAGERRLRAAKLVELDRVPVIVRSLDEQAKLELALIENVQRSDLNPIETAVAYRKLVDQFNLKLEEIGRQVGKSVPVVSNSMRLLNLPPEAIQAIIDGRITEGHARAILAVDPELRVQMLETVIDQHMSVRQAETLARGFKLPTADKQGALKHVSTQNQWTEALSQHLGTGVAINRRAQGGKLTIDFHDDGDLERISQRLLKS